MSNLMERGGYTARIELDPDEGMFHGRILNIRDVVSFYGRSVDELAQEFDRSLATYLEVCREKSIEPEKPYSGQFLVRTSPELHRDVTTAAAVSGTSVNSWVEAALTARLGEAPTGARKKPAKANAPKRKTAASRRRA